MSSTQFHFGKGTPLLAPLIASLPFLHSTLLTSTFSAIPILIPDATSLSYYEVPINISASSASSLVEVRVCNSAFIARSIILQECNQALAKLIASSKAEFYSNNQPWPYDNLHDLPLMVKCGSCTIKFEASALGASIVPNYLLIPDGVRIIAGRHLRSAKWHWGFRH